MFKKNEIIGILNSLSQINKALAHADSSGELKPWLLKWSEIINEAKNKVEKIKNSLILTEVMNKVIKNLYQLRKNFINEKQKSIKSHPLDYQFTYQISQLLNDYLAAIFHKTLNEYKALITQKKINKNEVKKYISELIFGEEEVSLEELSPTERSRFIPLRSGFPGYEDLNSRAFIKDSDVDLSLLIPCQSNYSLSLGYSKNESSFAEFINQGRRTDEESAWKLHFSFSPELKNTSQAWDIFTNIANKYQLPHFKISRQLLLDRKIEINKRRLEQASEKNITQIDVIRKDLESVERVRNGMQITVYIPKGQEYFYNLIALEVDKEFSRAKIIAGKIHNSDRALGDFASLRNQESKSGYKTFSDNYNPDNVVDPFFHCNELKSLANLIKASPNSKSKEPFMLPPKKAKLSALCSSAMKKLIKIEKAASTYDENFAEYTQYIIDVLDPVYSDRSNKVLEAEISKRRNKPVPIFLQKYIDRLLWIEDELAGSTEETSKYHSFIKNSLSKFAKLFYKEAINIKDNKETRFELLKQAVKCHSIDASKLLIKENKVSSLARQICKYNLLKAKQVKLPDAQLNKDIEEVLSKNSVESQDFNYALVCLSQLKKEVSSKNKELIFKLIDSLIVKEDYIKLNQLKVAFKGNKCLKALSLRIDKTESERRQAPEQILKYAREAKKLKQLEKAQNIYKRIISSFKQNEKHATIEQKATAAIAYYEIASMNMSDEAKRNDAIEYMKEASNLGNLMASSSLANYYYQRAIDSELSNQEKNHNKKQAIYFYKKITEVEFSLYKDEAQARINRLENKSSSSRELIKRTLSRANLSESHVIKLRKKLGIQRKAAKGNLNVQFESKPDIKLEKEKLSSIKQFDKNVKEENEFEPFINIKEPKKHTNHNTLNRLKRLYMEQYKKENRFFKNVNSYMLRQIDSHGSELNLWKMKRHAYFHSGSRTAKVFKNNDIKIFTIDVTNESGLSLDEFIQAYRAAYKNTWFPSSNSRKWHVEGNSNDNVTIETVLNYANKHLGSRTAKVMAKLLDEKYADMQKPENDLKK